jgi:hypothetical protein
MNLIQDAILVPKNPCFNLSPDTINRVIDYERARKAQITIALYDDGCNTAATIIKKSKVGTISFFYRFCCGEFYVDIDSKMDKCPTIKDFKNLDDLIFSVLGGNA